MGRVANRDEPASRADLAESLQLMREMPISMLEYFGSKLIGDADRITAAEQRVNALDEQINLLIKRLSGNG